MTKHIKRGITIDPREIRKTINKQQSVKAQVVTGDVVSGVLPEGSIEHDIDPQGASQDD